MFDALFRDLRHAVRGLRSRRTYAVVTIVTLTLVIGAASAVIAVVNATMIRPLPFPHEDRLVQLFTMPPGTSGVAQRNPLHTREFYRFRTGGLRLVEAIEGVWARDRALSGGAEPESVPAAAVSAGALALFGGRPFIGRTFTEDEDRANARVVVLGYGVWQRRFGGDPGVLGRTVLIDREAHEVIGIMPPSFTLAYIASEFWTPLNITEAALDNPSSFTQTFARLRHGVTVAQLGAELQPAMRSVIAEAPTLIGWSAEVTTLRAAQFGRQRSSLLVLLGGVVALALIACANLANLTLTQVMSRRSEIALRAALGGGFTAIVRLQVIETLLLTAAGVAAGILIGSWTLPALLSLDPTTARTLSDVQIDWRVQASTAALALVVALLSGVLPLVRALKGDVARGLADGGRCAIGSRHDERVRHVLVGAESAMAVVLLASGALLLSGFSRTSAINPGFDPNGVLGAQMRLSASAYPTEAARAALIAQVLERVRAIPGVSAASATLNPFIPGFAFVTLVKIEGKPTPDGQAHTVQFRRVSPQYFKTLRIPAIRGVTSTSATDLRRRR